MAPGKQHASRKRNSGSAEALGNGDKLPYRIELWEGATVDRLLALAGHASLARAIYKAATTEHPGRVVVLSRGTKIIARSTARQEP
jgi:hypothetical protein